MTASPFPVSDEPHLEEVLGQIHDRLGRIEERMATKDDLRGFATRDDLKGFATKDDLKGFATRDDFKGFATKDDLDVVVREVRTGYADVNESLAAIHDKLDRQ